MRLLKQVSREYQGTKYEKHWIVIPNDLVKKLGWKVGQDLKSEIRDNKLVLEKD